MNRARVKEIPFHAVLAGFAVALVSVGSGLALASDQPPRPVLNPYMDADAPVRDVRARFAAEDPLVRTPPDLAEMRREKARDLGLRETAEPIRGALGAGTSYKTGELRVHEHAELHTKMFVHENGVEPSFPVDWLYTPATNRTEMTIEVVGIYSQSYGNSGYLGIYDWSCTAGYPCPNGDSEASWQWAEPFSDFACNIEVIVDPGGHDQDVMHYANTSVKMDNENPPLWWNAVYLWNFCSDDWDLIYDHQFRSHQRDCSLNNSCGWWGPIIETFGDPQPAIKELGFTETMLYHDGIWSELSTAETYFHEPIGPWALFHLEPNQGFGVGGGIGEPVCGVVGAEGACAGLVFFCLLPVAVMIGLRRTDTSSVAPPESNPRFSR